jgi:hypothetical protein
VSRPFASRLAWSLWALNIVVGALLLAFSPQPGDLSSAFAGVLFIVGFATPGALLASRRPENPIGWLMCASALAFTVGGVAVEYSDYAFREHREDLPAVALAAWVGTFVWIIGVGPAATFLLLLFPNGKLPSPRWRAVAGLAGAGLALTVVSLALNPGRIEDTRVSNPLGIPGGEAILNAVGAAGAISLAIGVVASVTSLIMRFRGAQREERQQLKWIAYAAPLMVLGLIASEIASRSSSDAAVNLSNTMVSLSLAFVPVAIGTAVLRYRLYDIDVVINRTLVYGVLTATLAAAYLGTVLVLQLALSPLTERSDLAIAGSTLAVAALFSPARQRIQELVDRRFYRSRYDAARTLESFGARLRNEVDLEALGAELRSVVAQTMQPASVSLWLRTPGAPR